MIKVFIGSDIDNVKAERALIYSILKHTSSKVEFTIMSRYGSDITWKNWQKTEHWSTKFSCYRWAIPAACNFTGKAIYLDSDMVVLSDIEDLFMSDVPHAIATSPKRESSVMVFDCEKFADLPQFKLSALKADAAKTNSYYKFLNNNKMVSFISQHWNCLDGEGWDSKETKLVHYTNLKWQPWHPAPSRFEYVTHPHPVVKSLWQKYYEESFDPMFLEGIPLRGHVSPLEVEILK